MVRRENVGISKTEAKSTKLTALEIRAEEHHRKTVKFNIKKKKWSVQLPWIDPDLESHRLTDNLKKVTAMMRKVHDVVLEEDMPMVNQAYMDCLLYTSPSPRDRQKSRMPSSA